MTACTYFVGKTCPETTPSDARCQICIALLQIFNNQRIKHNVIVAKLPT